VRVDCHVIDYGPGGLLAFQRAAVYRELGLPEPPPAHSPTIETVRNALRDYGSPARLATNPMAPAQGGEAERAAAVKARVDEAVRSAFGPSREDQLLYRVLSRGYIDPAPTHELAAVELNLSRTTYFRSLRVAVGRVAAQLGVRNLWRLAPIRHFRGTDGTPARP
jgi:hypothetical protein